MKTCLIISGGDFNRLPEAIEYDYTIACDRGYEHAVSLGIAPDMIIGDYDSLSLDKIKKDLRNKGLSDTGVLKFPVKKDDSDTMLAIKHALEKGYDNIIVTCALGGRFDHTFANIQSMVYAKEHGADCRIISENERMHILKNGSLVLKKRPGHSLSVFSLSNESRGVTIKGALYETEDITLTNTFPLGLSNVITASETSISVKEGTLLLVESFMGDDNHP